jgi:hypothetical protein
MVADAGEQQCRAVESTPTIDTPFLDHSVSIPQARGLHCFVICVKIRTKKRNKKQLHAADRTLTDALWPNLTADRSQTFRTDE